MVHKTKGVKPLEKCPFLMYALSYIRENPGCSKADIIRSDKPDASPGTVSYRNQALNVLLRKGLVADRRKGGKAYQLHATGKEENEN